MSSVDRDSQKVWRSLDEFARSHEPHGSAGESPSAASAGEFAEGASSPPEGHSRRRFLQVMAASASLAGLSGCRWPKENILPYARRPAELTPGEPLQFATAMEIAGRVQGLVVSSYDGRPIKVDGNPLHPMNAGASDLFAQASVLDLYDADRARNPVQLDRTAGKAVPFDRTWNELDQFLKQHFAQLRQNKGLGLAVLSEVSSSPSLAAMRERFLKTYPQARWTTYEPTSSDSASAGIELAFGQPLRAHYSIDRAKVLVALDSDFMTAHPAALQMAREFVKGHTPASDNAWSMSRLYVIEPTYSVTGGMADNRLPAQARSIWPILCRISHLLTEQGLDAGLLPVIPQAKLDSRAETFAQAITKDLIEARGQSAILVGDSQPAHVHALAHLLGESLGSIGQTVAYSAEPQPRDAAPAGIRSLVEAVAAGQVQTLLILGGNPSYNAPADLDFAGHLAKVPTAIHLAHRWNETARQCAWLIPMAHYLEAWGDVRSYDGTYSITQPVIAPLYDGRSVIELLSQLAESPGQAGYDIVRQTARQTFANRATDSRFDELWRKLLNDGALAKSAYPMVRPHARNDRLAEHIAKLPPVPATAGSASNDLEIVFRADPRVLDGRFANNAWLQETPDTMTKITWDNAALVSPETARHLSLKQNQIVQLSLGKGRSVQLPVYVMPGQADGSITVFLGYGRTSAGHVGNGVGVDVYPLRTTEAMHFAGGLDIRRTDRSHALALTQHHFDIDPVGRKGEKVRLEEVAAEMTLAEWKKNPSFAAQREYEPHRADLWKPVDYPGPRWGMAVDLHKCIGCNACVVACQAENNVPVVGREQVQRRRHMQWLRIDRYFRGDDAAPHTTFQPMFCMHCQTAPCEAVCPVAATLHDGDGLNLMVYNRCVGTRYCSNNCPYKVRRFNFYHWNKDVTRLEAMVKNPDVTVRGRGVMEKCTYCVQRIQRAKIRAKNERRPIATDEFTSACAQACPTGAIVFGNLEDPASAVSMLQRGSRSYAVLAEFNTQPRSLHMVRLRNPSPLLAEPDDHMRHTGTHET